MTDQLPVLATRQNGAVTARPAQPAMSLSEVERVCNMIATGGDIVPPAYRNKPGAVLLAKLWGDANGVDVFTAMQNISIVEGRTFVSAEMRVAMGTARGFEFRVIESTRELCTIEVWRGAELRGHITARYDDMPRKLQYKSGAATPWKLHPDDMLFAEACRKADRRYVKTAAALLDAAQDYGDTPDPLYVLAAQAGPSLATSLDDLIDPELAEAIDGPAAAELVADIVPEPEPDEALTVNDLLAAAQLANVARPRAALLKHAQTVLGWSGGTLDDLVADQHVATLLLNDLAAGEVQ